MEIDDDLFAKMVQQVVLTALDQTTDSFRANPNGSHWKDLEDAMWARQAIASPATLNQAVKLLRDKGVGVWVTELRKLHEGKK